MEKHLIRKCVCVLTFLVSSFYTTCSFSQPKEGSRQDSSAVLRTVNQFTHAFSSLNWQDFSAFFASDATAFFPPSAKFQRRANNKLEITTIFQRVFENAARQKSSPPYIIIEPKDLRIQMLGEVAVVTFLLEDPGMLGRRTIVFGWENNRWVIKHLHASGVPL